MKRRAFVADFARIAALCAVVPNDWRVVYRPRLPGDPFTLGVASGDPTSTSAVIWTRLAQRPLEPDGGMGSGRLVVSWEVANDDSFRNVVKTGRATAAMELGHSIHVDVDGLSPDRWYFYRFMVSDATSPVGRLRTAPATGAATPLRFAVASCQHYEFGHFTAYRHMAAEELDLVTHLGDYIYEYGEEQFTSNQNRIRAHVGLEIRTLDDYRRRYAQYKSDAMLQAAHAHCPWIVTWDDHEVDNNYAASIGENVMESDEQVHARRAAGYQAWWEHQPVRVPRVKSWADLTIRRGFDWGSLARLWVLDGRQYRSDQPCSDGDKVVPCGEWAEPSRTMLGQAQERWLHDGLGTSRGSWQILANQVMVAPFDSAAGSETRLALDQWSGYPAARDRLLGAIAQHAPNRTIVLTGDIHSSWVNELKSSFSARNARAVATELVGTSIASGGDGSERSTYVTDALLAENPHVKWQHNRRGYFTCRVTPEAWQVQYRTVPFVSRPDAPIETPSRWRIIRGRAAVERE